MSEMFFSDIKISHRAEHSFRGLHTMSQQVHMQQVQEQGKKRALIMHLIFSLLIHRPLVMQLSLKPRHMTWYMHVDVHLSLRIVTVLLSPVMWKGLTQGLTPGATDGAFSHPPCSARACMHANARTHAHTHEKHNNIAYFTFFLGGMVDHAVHQVYSAVVRTRSSYRSPGSGKWDVDRYAMRLSLPLGQVDKSEVKGSKSAVFVRKYFPRHRDAQDTAGDTDEWREGFHLSLYCELSVVTLSRVLGVLKAYSSARHLLSRTPLSLTSSTEQTEKVSDPSALSALNSAKWRTPHLCCWPELAPSVARDAWLVTVSACVCACMCARAPKQLPGVWLHKWEYYNGTAPK